MTFDSTRFWERRYQHGGNSGEGSMGKNAKWKADHLNAFVKDHKVGSVVEFGCGDGRQLALSEYPQYVGLDVSETAVELCRHRMADRPEYEFDTLPPADDWQYLGYDLSLSIDVAYHLPDDDVFAQHLRDVFDASTRWVILYTTDLLRGEPYPESSDHVLHRPVKGFVFVHFHDWALASVTYNEMDGCYFMVFGRKR